MTRKPSETWPEDKWRDPSDSQEIEGPQCQQPYQEVHTFTCRLHSAIPYSWAGQDPVKMSLWQRRAFISSCRNATRENLSPCISATCHGQRSTWSWPMFIRKIPPVNQPDALGEWEQISLLNLGEGRAQREARDKRSMDDHVGRPLFFWNAALFGPVHASLFQSIYVNDDTLRGLNWHVKHFLERDEQWRDLGTEAFVELEDAVFPAEPVGESDGVADTTVRAPVHGRIWCLNFSRSGGILPLPVLAFLAVQTHRGPEHDENIHDPFVCFGQAYAAPWPSTGPRSTHYETSARWMLRILYHTRCFVVTSRVLDDGKRATSSLMQEPVTVSAGLKLARGFAQSSGSFPLHGRTLCIEEVRAAILLTQELDPARPLFSIICLSDSDQIFSATRKLRDGTDDRMLRMWPEVLKGQGLAGINAFQNTVSVWLEDWAAAWNASLDEINTIINVNLDDVIRKDWISEHMFDDSFQVSAMYSSVLHLLRIFSTHITESATHVGELRYAIRWDILGKERALTVKENLDILVLNKNRLSDQLLRRIQDKTAEIESLRDAIFNATSLREASASSEVNSYLFIFTVMTIFFLPLSFVTSIFGMHLFDKEDPSANQTTFYITMVLTAITTYVAALSAVWFIAPPAQREKLKTTLGRALGK